MAARKHPQRHRHHHHTGGRTAPLDSTALRLSWNPTRELSLQGSWVHLEEPEQLEPGVGKVSLGLARVVDLSGPFGMTVGALASVNLIPDGLCAEYGKKHSLGAMAFLRFRIDRPGGAFDRDRRLRHADQGYRHQRHAQEKRQGTKLDRRHDRAGRRLSEGS